IFCAVGGVEPQSETVWRQADKYNVPRIAFVNKMDRVGADYYSVVSQIKDKLKSIAVPIQIPIGSEDSFKGVIDLIDNKAVIWYDDETMGTNYNLVEIPEDLKKEAAEWREKMLEAVAETDDSLLERYFEDTDSITPEEIRDVIRRATIERTIVPVMCGSAFKNKGVQRLMDAIAGYLPSPLDVGAVTGIHPKINKEIERDPDNEQPMSALAFKIATDPFVGRLAYLRIYSGTIYSNSSVYNPRTNKRERITRLYQMHANKQNPKDKIEAGDICAAVGFKSLKTGDTLCDIKQPISLESMVFPDPVIGIAIEPKTQADVDKLGIALGKLSEEDPTFQVRTDEESGQTIIRGMGELHLE
ncbi:MAG: elongation factor G, partial [Bacteroidales bacterium]|nr:elongation factor G [Bacteroidales bacterium]